MSLIVLYEGRRKTIKAGPNTTMYAVLQEACSSLGISAAAVSSYSLQHKRTVVDLSQAYRYTGIPQNATIELVQDKEGGKGSSKGGKVVRIACKAAGGVRLEGSFAPDTTLSAMLTSWAEEGRLRQEDIENVSLVFMRQKFTGDELRNTNLAAMGLTGGSAMFTLSGAEAMVVPAVAETTGAPSSSSSSSSSMSSGAAAAATAAEKVSAEAADASSSLIVGPIVAPSPPLAAIATTTTPGATGTSIIDSDMPPPLESPHDISAREMQSRSSNNQDNAAHIATAPQVPAIATTPMTGVAERKQNDTDNVDIDDDGDDKMSLSPSMIAVVSAVAGAASSAIEIDDVTSTSTSTAAAEDMNGLLLRSLGLPSGDGGNDMPAAGLKTCQQALEQMRAGHFDVDSREGVLTLIRYVDNIIHRPGEERTRTIKSSNATFKKKVGSLKGGKEFLFGLGFTIEILPGLSRELARDPEAFVQLRLTPAMENARLLRDARVLLGREAANLGIPADQIPKPPVPKTQPQAYGGSGGGMAATIAFDPYKPMVLSTAPQPNRPAGAVSSTEARLQELKAVREKLEEQVGIPDRDIVVQLTTYQQTRSGLSTITASADNEDIEDIDDAKDRAIMAKHLAQQMAQQRKREDAPITTRAMRELESLKKAKVYRHTLIKVQFPDRAVLMAKFHPKEKVKDVLKVIRSNLAPAYSSSLQFHLYVSPPKQTLKPEDGLQELGLVPAAVVYVSWETSPSPDFGSEGDYLKPELLTAATPSGSFMEHLSSVPAGVALVSEQMEDSSAQGNSSSGGAKRSGVNSSSESKGKGKKPGWLKL